jgi:hypothetical protein
LVKQYLYSYELFLNPISLMVHFPIAPFGIRLLPVCIFLLAANVYVQDTFQFTKGLIVPVSYQYGREALYTDPLAYQLYTNSLKLPAEGAAFATDDSGRTVTWQAVIADGANRLYKRGLGQGSVGCGGYVGAIVDSMYHTRPDGYAGKEDCGQMSAWGVWSMAGLYPANPASGQYVFRNPVFESGCGKK